VTLAPKGLLIEEQRTNLLLRSQEFDSASWAPQNATVTANVVVAPDGTLTADKLVENTATSQHRVDQTPTSSAGAQTFSFFAKQAERSFVNTRIGLLGASFSLIDGSVAFISTGVTSASSVNFGNGWYRCSITVNAAANDICRINIQTTASSPETYQGDGISGIYLWGAQLEQAAFSTSYIPTVASQVTRAADSASMIGNNFARWYTQGAGTLLASFDFSGAGSSANPNIRTAFNISDGTSNNRLQIYNISGNVGSFIAAGGASQAALDTFSPVPVDVFRTVALAYASNDAIQAVNGSLSSNDTSVILPVVNAAYIGSEPASARLNGHVRRIAYYNRRLANTELQGITS
jgi:hypothetical protein